MTSNLIPTLEYIASIKEDIRLAINSRGGVVTGGVPFEQWGSILAGLVFDEDTVQNPGTKPVKPTPAPLPPAPPVVTPINPTDLPSDFDIGTSGLTPIAVGFAYGSLQFDFTGAVGSVEEVINPEPEPEPDPIKNEYTFTINGQPPDVMTGIGTFNEVNGTFTGYLWDDAHATASTEAERDRCGSDASCAWGYAHGYTYGSGYGRYYYYATVDVENLPVTLC